MFRIFHNVGAPISILEELAKTIRLYVPNDNRFALKEISVGIGSNLVNLELINQGNFDRIVEIAKEYTAQID